VLVRRSRVLVVLVISQAGGLALVVLVWAITQPETPSAERILYGALAGVAGVIGLVAFYRGFAVGAMGVVAPITSTAVMIPLAVGLARGERPSTLQAVGIGLALAGVLGASYEATHGNRARIAVGSGLALIAAASFGCALLGLSAAAKGGAVWAALSLRGAGTPLVVAAALLVRVRGERLIARGWPAMAAVGAGDAGANILYSAASTRGLLSVVAVLASLYPAIVVALARLVLHERLHAIQRVGAMTTLAGVALISVG
jgi:drug/metabolite transporter (DMT)-like permease